MAEDKKKERALLAFGILGLLGLLGGATYLLTRPAAGAGGGGGGGGGGKRKAVFQFLNWMRDNQACRIGVEGYLLDEIGVAIPGRTVALYNISAARVMSAVQTDSRGYFRAPAVGLVDASAGGGAGWRVFFDGSADSVYESTESPAMAGPACAVAFVPTVLVV
jgi:hypothetical protein